MIQLLIIQPENREIHEFRRFQFNNFSQLTVPYLASFVDERYYTLTLMDEYCQRIPYHKPFDLVAITVNTPNAPHCYEISERFRKKGVKVVMGGPHATLLPQEVKAHCDHLMIGEGEITWPLFLHDFQKGMAKDVYQSDTPSDLTNLPFPRWDLIKRSNVMKGVVFATRGCPYHCRYCNLKQIYFDCFRMRPVADMVEEISRLPSRFFVFWDDNLFANIHYAKGLLRAMAPLKRRWAAQASLRDCKDDELLMLAKSAGCIYLFIGFESFSEASLSDAGKLINQVADYKPLIDKIHHYGIMIQAGIVFGFDGDTKNVFEETLTACEALGIDGATVSILTPFPQTPIYEQLKEEGRLLSNDWSQYNSKTAVAFQPKNMTPSELFDGYLRFRRQFFSIKSFIKRMRVSKTNIATNFVMNFGYRLALGKSNRHSKRLP